MYPFNENSTVYYPRPSRARQRYSFFGNHCNAATIHNILSPRAALRTCLFFTHPAAATVLLIHTYKWFCGANKTSPQWIRLLLPRQKAEERKRKKRREGRRRTSSKRTVREGLASHVSVIQTLEKTRMSCFVTHKWRWIVMSGRISPSLCSKDVMGLKIDNGQTI